MVDPSNSTMRLLSALPVVLFVGLVGCVSTEEPADEGTSLDGADVAVVSDAATSVPFRKALRDVDVHIGRFVTRSLESGTQARQERDLEASHIRAVVERRLDEFLEQAADESEPTFRQVAVKALGFTDDRRAVELLSETLRTARDPRLLTNATFAASVSGSPDLDAQALLPLLAGDDADIRSNSLVALRKVFEARARIGRDPIDPGDRELALGLLEAALIDPEDPIVRGNAAGALGSLRDRRSVDALVDRLSDTNPFIRTHTALALGKIADPKAIPALLEVIDETPRETPRQAVLTALTILLERNGRTVPDYLDDTERTWKTFVRERRRELPENFPGTER